MNLVKNQMKTYRHRVSVKISVSNFLAEGARFELAIPCGMRAFQARALGHYATPPLAYLGTMEIILAIAEC